MPGKKLANNRKLLKENENRQNGMLMVQHVPNTNIIQQAVPLSK